MVKKGSGRAPAGPLAFLMTFFLFIAPLSAAEKVTVFAAGSTTNAVAEAGKLFEEKKGALFIPSFASSSTLAKQIESGAPANVFISANREWMDYLEKRGMIDTAGRFDLMSNQLILIAPSESKLAHVEIRPDFDLSGLLADGKLAMGDPDHVPAGMYGKKALETLGVWQSIESAVARAKDVRAALVLVERGEAPLGVVYATDAAISDKVKVVGAFPENSHPPIVYPVALVAGQETPEAKSFLEFLKTAEAMAIFEKYGFLVR